MVGSRAIWATCKGRIDALADTSPALYIRRTVATIELTWADDSNVAFEQLTASVKRALAKHTPPVRIVEAGCGRKWALGDLGTEIQITGIDLDPEALRLRVEQRKDLDTAIQGDLMEVEVPAASYDMVFSSWVLEHLEDPEAALDRFFSWLRPGGLVVAILPDRDTAKGFLTRISPFFIHVWYYRWVMGRPTAGKPGYEPYHTHYGKVVGRKGIEEYCCRHGYRVVDEIAVRVARGDFGLLTRVVSKMVGWLSFGKLDGEYCDIAVVVEKP
jgi:SAM-dependent methyltransferase